MFNLVACTTGVLTLIFIHVNALDYESSIESPCFKVKTVPVDANWILSTPMSYYSLMNRYDLYHVGTGLAGKKPNEIREDELYYDMCATFWFGVGEFSVKMFGRTRKYLVNPIRGLEEYIWGEENNEVQKYPYHSYTTLTDNKTFIFLASCLDGHMSFAVSSVMKRLPEETTKLIYDHAESLGFKRQHFTALRYDSCEKGFEGKGNRETSEDEL